MNSTIRRFALAFAVLVVLACSPSVRADTLLYYQITGPGSNGTLNVDFTIGMHPTPSWGNALLFGFSNLPVNVNGAWTNLNVAFSSLLGGGVAGSNTFALIGAQLFSWPSSSSGPIMNAGVFTLKGVSGGGLGTYTVTVTTGVASVPESASLAFLVAGLLALFGGRRLRLLAPPSAA